jgi:GTP-binding protein HflX
MREKAVLVTADFHSIKRLSSPRDCAAELKELCRAAGLDVEESFIFRQRKPAAPYLLGKGQMEEAGRVVRSLKADVVVFESDLSSSQQRNLEELLGAKTIDRTQLILDIFAQRARSTEGKLQVELAQLKYLLPRLSGKGIYLSRLGGGVGTRGPGEQKLEVDRRRIRERISRLSGDLKELDARRLAGIQRKKEMNLPLIAIVGYTHAGKSTLFNRLTYSSVGVKHKLFSTLDTTTRALTLPGNKKALLVDTVGFIRELPHHLVESFKATLEEAVHADILLHVADGSRADKDVMAQSVREVLKELGVEQKRTLLVLNKMDLLSESEVKCLRENSPWWSGVFVSGKTGAGIPDLLKRLSAWLGEEWQTQEIFLPKERLGEVGKLYRSGEVLSRLDEAHGSTFHVKMSPAALAAFQKR